MKDTRPRNIDFKSLSSFQLPITGYVSILHRISGLAIFIGVGFLLYFLQYSLSSPDHFEMIKHPPLACKIILFLIYVGFIYHLVAGIRHLLMDWGVGESKAGGKAGAYIVLVISIGLIAATGVWLWA